MYLTLVIGMTGQGKSRFTKAAIDDKRCFVYDVQNEYDFLEFEKPTDPPKERARYFGDMNIFLNKVETRRNCTIVFEEATAFLKGQIGKRLTNIIISKRHTQNNLFFIFHSINSVPPAIFDLCNWVVLFKTNDYPTNIKGGMKTLVKPCAWLKTQPQYTKLIIKTI